MSQYTTRYKTENGKTRKAGSAVKQTKKNKEPESSGAENKQSRTEEPAKQGV
jgi:heme-binding NEAT domain protein